MPNAACHEPAWGQTEGNEWAGGCRSSGDADVSVWWQWAAAGEAGWASQEEKGGASWVLYAPALPFPLLLALRRPLTSCQELVRSFCQRPLPFSLPKLAC